MRCLFQHGGEAKNVSFGRLVDEHVLLVLVYSGDPDLARNHHIGRAAGVADFIDSLARGERSCSSTWEAKTAASSSSRRSKSGTFFENLRFACHGGLLSRQIVDRIRILFEYLMNGALLWASERQPRPKIVE